MSRRWRVYIVLILCVHCVYIICVLFLYCVYIVYIVIILCVYCVYIVCNMMCIFTLLGQPGDIWQVIYLRLELDMMQIYINYATLKCDACDTCYLPEGQGGHHIYVHHI